MSRRLTVDPIACTGHGACAELFPERIGLDDWGYPILDDGRRSPTSCSSTPAAPSPPARRSRCACATGGTAPTGRDCRCRAPADHRRRPRAARRPAPRADARRLRRRHGRRRRAGAWPSIAAQSPDAVVLDIGMPGVDGLEVCRRLRAAGDRVPVLMLTARDAVDDRIDGLDAGADDYLVKPFDVGELKARLRALLRRATAPTTPTPTRPPFDELRLDPARHGVVVGDRFAELTRTEYQLLELLHAQPAPGPARTTSSTTASGATTSVRRPTRCASTSATCGASSSSVGARPLIRTVRGVGYVLREP